MNLIATFIIWAFSLQSQTPVFKPFEDNGLYGLEIQTDSANYFIPPCLMYADADGNVGWDQNLKSKLHFKKDFIIADNKFSTLKAESPNDVAFLCIIGQLPSSWWVTDIDGNYYEPKEMGFLILDYETDDNVGSYVVRFPSGSIAHLNIYPEWNKIVITKIED